MTFGQAIEIILRLEAGYSNDSNDPGGETKWGISKRAFPHINIKDLSVDEARLIYKQQYWDKLRLSEMPDEVRLAVFDCAVNQGPQRAILLCQKALGIKADGVVGPVTIAAFGGVPARAFLTNYLTKRFDAYIQNPQWSVFGRGWMKRLLEITFRSLS
jgi:lysozyme family protein